MRQSRRDPREPRIKRIERIGTIGSDDQFWIRIPSRLMPTVISGPSARPAPLSLRDCLLMLLTAVGFAILCLALESWTRALGFPTASLFERVIYWSYVASMSALGALLVIATPFLMLSSLPFMWLRLTRPHEFARIQRYLDANGHTISYWQFLPALGMSIGGLMLLWPVVRLWLSK